MTTLSLEDLDAATLRALGLDAPCRHPGCRDPALPVIPVVRIDERVDTRESPDGPGAAWLATGLHRLRVAEA